MSESPAAPPHGPYTTARALRYAARALRLRCPICGISPLFKRAREVRSLRDWLTPLPGWPRCGYDYHREPGYFLLAVWGFDYFFVAIVGLVIVTVLELTLRPSTPVLLLCTLTPLVPLALFVARYGKALFLALDTFWDPPR
jgi:uncharacterized protein (DUF983 family)